MATSSADGLPGPAGAAVSRPNFIVIVVDDLDSASLPYMPATTRLLADQGAVFTRFFATTPLCCPSRASILRGQYAHNHGVLRNTGDDAGFASFHGSGHESATIATLLQGSGYQTAHIGKYLNGYSLAGDEQTYVPPGWNTWVAGVDHAAYESFNYDLNVNGELVSFGHKDDDYLTDVLASQALNFLDASASAVAPFFLYLAPYAPHSPATPAPRHQDLFRTARAPRTPAFNERNVRDKPDWIQATPRLSDEKLDRIDDDFRRRLQSLQAVDEMVDSVVQRLETQGTLDSTYILLLSDNGYFMGEHRQPHGKDAPYDAASRVPLIVRGPDIAAGASVGELALNIDVLPTIADLAGVSTPRFVDGRSLAPLLFGRNGSWRESALIEGFGKETESIEALESVTPAFRALRTEGILYVEYETHERELYDLQNDPFELANIEGDVSRGVLRDYARQLDALSSCAGHECARAEDASLPALSLDRNGREGHSQGARRAWSSTSYRRQACHDLRR